MTTLEKIDHKIAQLHKQRTRITQRENKQKRKIETRAKIILGGALLATCKADDRWNKLVSLIVKTNVHRPRDLKTLIDAGILDDHIVEDASIISVTK